MSEQTVAMYCFLDDFLRIARPRPADLPTSDARSATPKS